MLSHESGDAEPGSWIGLAKAVERIRKRLRVSVKKASDRLIEVARSGRVRTTGISPHWGYQRKLIQHFWYRRPSLVVTSCNLRNDSITNPADGTITRVQVNAEELEDWLRGEVEPNAPLGPKRASEPQIRKAIDAVYDEAQRNKAKPPNLNRLPPLVQARPREQGRDASYRHIQRLAADTAHRRRKRGPTLFAERAKNVDLRRFHT